MRESRRCPDERTRLLGEAVAIAREISDQQILAVMLQEAEIIDQVKGKLAALADNGVQ